MKATKWIDGAHMPSTFNLTQGSCGWEGSRGVGAGRRSNRLQLSGSSVMA